ncbi:hypothetical protein ITJ54_07420 [Curtobacterium sp. VKM Ac-2865]|uniref:hypothetical protein n=1 Tax=Curtobacterium sp. VKM Ac-2865 TaxID=2783817 RepID=UPI001889F75B|nr:hypothetical protein [Curtobacterium sp. VKM Ac-2865]MBF4582497.1 hypothetical protein [Curtobacterium sp. VKM Ac-2865]
MTIQTQHPIYFGIGCYTFEAPDADLLTMVNPEGSYSIHSWSQDVEAALRSIPSLDNIEVSGFHSVRGDHPFNWRETTRAALHSLPHSSLHRGGDFRPHPVNGQIRFDATIPVHIQNEVFPYVENRRGTRFTVHISYAFGMPVAFVRTYDDHQDPSTAVAIVREFLKREFDKQIPAGNPIKFVCMGPSPAWLNLVLNAPESGPVDEADRVTVIDTPGYKWVTMRIAQQPGVMTVEDAYDFLRAVISESAAVFYDLVSEMAISALTRQYIETQLQKLVELHRAPGFRSWLRRVWSAGKSANDLMLEILAVDLEEKRSFAASKERWNSIRSASGKKIIAPVFNIESSRDIPDYVPHARAVVDLLSTRQSRSIELIGVITSAVIGGAAGAALTAFFQ